MSYLSYFISCGCLEWAYKLTGFRGFLTSSLLLFSWGVNRDTVANHANKKYHEITIVGRSFSMKGAMATWYHGNPNKTTDYKKYYYGWGKIKWLVYRHEKIKAQNWCHFFVGGCFPFVTSLQNTASIGNNIFR